MVKIVKQACNYKDPTLYEPLAENTPSRFTDRTKMECFNNKIIGFLDETATNQLFCNPKGPYSKVPCDSNWPGSTSPSISPSTSPSPSLAGKSYRVDPVAFSYVTISFATGTTGSYRGYDDNGSGDLNGSFTYSVSGSTISLSAYIPLINENSFRINNNTLIGNSTGTSLNKI